MLAWRVMSSSAGKQSGVFATNTAPALSQCDNASCLMVMYSLDTHLRCRLSSCDLLQLLQLLLVGDCLQTTQPQPSSPTSHSKAFQGAVVI